MHGIRQTEASWKHCAALQNYIFQFVTRNFCKTVACYTSLSDLQQILELWNLRSRATRSSGTYLIPIISCLISVLFTWLSDGTTLDSLGALNRQMFAKSIDTYTTTCIHIYIHAWPEPIFYRLLDSCFAPSALSPRLNKLPCFPIPYTSALFKPAGALQQNVSGWPEICLKRVSLSPGTRIKTC